MTRAPGSIKAAFAALMLHIRIVDGSGSCDKNIKAAPLRNKLVDLLLKKSPGKPRPKNKRFKKRKKGDKIFEPTRISNFIFQTHRSSFEVEAARRRDIPIFQHACKAQLVHKETATRHLTANTVFIIRATGMRAHSLAAVGD